MHSFLFDNIMGADHLKLSDVKFHCDNMAVVF